MAELDLGFIVKALAAKAGLTGIKGMTRANELNRYAQGINAGLPQGYQVPYQDRGFFFGDLGQSQQMLDALSKRQWENYNADYYSQYGGIPRGPLDAVKDFYNSEVAPMRQEYGKRNIEGQFGRRELESMPYLDQYYDQLNGQVQQPAPPQNQPLPQPQDIGGGVMLEPDPSLSPQFQAQAQEIRMPQQPPLPQNFYVTPQTLRTYMGNRTTQRGQDITMRGQDLTRQTAKERIGEQKRVNDVRIKKILQDMQLNPMKVQAYIRSLSQRSGRAPTKTEIAQQMYRDGEITRQQFKDFILKAPDIGFLQGLMGGDTPAPPASEGGDFPSFEEYDAGY